VLVVCSILMLGFGGWFIISGIQQLLAN
jgi:hypothetical protein